MKDLRRRSIAVAAASSSIAFVLLGAAVVSLSACDSTPAKGDDVASEVLIPDAGGVDGVSDVPATDLPATDTADTTPHVDVMDAGDADSAEIAEPECTVATVAVDCQDLDTCTEDMCVDGVCVNASIDGCCKTDDACDDGVACTVDSCNTILKQCQFLAGSNLCCLTAADCDDGEACTADLCAAHQCVFVREASAECACTSNTQCDDGSDCTVDMCQAGSCTHTPGASAGCCAVDAHCDDGDPTTFDHCQYGSCWNAALPCAADVDCVATSGCLEATCGVEAICAFTSVSWSGCCGYDGDCDDDNDATDDACIEGQCVYALGAPVACAADTECTTPNACVVSECAPVAGYCSATALDGSGCCSSAADCSAPSDYCTAAVCDSLSCATTPLSGMQPWWQEDFGSEAAGSEVAGWTLVQDGGGAHWQVGQEQAISAPSSLYYGRLPELDYDVGHTQGSVTSVVLTVPAGVTATTLSFWVAGDIEPISSTDQLWVDVVVAGQATMVWSKNTAGGLGTGWTEQSVNLTAYVGAPFQIRISFDSIDGQTNTGEGVYIDEMQLLAQCP